MDSRKLNADEYLKKSERVSQNTWFLYVYL